MTPPSPRKNILRCGEIQRQKGALIFVFLFISAFLSVFFCAWPEKVLKTLVRSLTLPKQSSDCFHSRTKYRSRSQKKKKAGSKNTFSSFAGVCTNVQFTLMHCILAHRSSFYLVLESSRSICILFWLGEETSASQYQLYYNSSYPCNAWRYWLSVFWYFWW